MKKTNLAGYVQIGSALRHWIDLGRNQKDGAMLMSDANRAQLVTSIESMKDWFSTLKADNASALAEQICVKAKTENLHWIETATICESLVTVANTEFRKIFAGYIPPEMAKYWELEKPFGDVVYDKFPSIRAEVVSAGNCYAIEEFTACMFHLMRVAEIGMRILARRSRVSIPSRSLEYADWQTVISALQKTVTSLENKKRGSAREAALGFYRGMIADCSFFKEKYRHPLMHSRSSHIGPETLMVMTRVCEFMQRLATKIDEGDTKPITWVIK